MQGQGSPSCLCLLPRLEPMGRRVISPELGCVKAEDMPGASGTRPTILGPGSGSRSPGQCWKFGSPTRGVPPSSWGCLQRRGIRSPPTSSSKPSSEGFAALTRLLLSPPGNPHRPGLTCRFWSGFQRCQEKQEDGGNGQKLHHGSVRPHSSGAGGTCCGEKMMCNQR